MLAKWFINALLNYLIGTTKDAIGKYQEKKEKGEINEHNIKKFEVDLENLDALESAKASLDLLNRTDTRPRP